MEKLDLTKKHRSYYTAKTKPELIELPETAYLSITGKGDPSSSIFTERIQALYSVAYSVKFLCKARKKDFVVSKLEGLWWFDGSYGSFSFHEAPKRVPRAEWQWRLLIRTPEFVNAGLVETVASGVAEKKKLPLAKEVSMFNLPERKVVQMLHVGPFDNEPETLEQMSVFIKEHNFQKAGHHHEVYLSDLNKTEAAKLKTILREPVK